MVTLSGSMSPDGRMSFSPGGPGGFSPGGFGGNRDNDRDRGAERFREQDRNNDGRVSRDEADRQLQPNFERIDRDNDGSITLDEYRGYYAAQQSDRDRDRGNDRNRDMGNFGGNWGGGGWGGGDAGSWGNRQDPRGSHEEERPVAIRYGHLPKDLPDWFHDYDATKDGQIALHEWLKGAKAAGETASVESFAVYDLNHDQLITAEEVLRYGRLQADAKRVAAIQDGESVRPSLGSPGGGRTRGPGSFSAPSGGFTMSGSNSDKAVSTERGPAKRDSEKKSEKKSESSDKSEKSDRSEQSPGSNGRWGTGGKKPKG
jgi:Ca2+-binding EF-hand superfamily protein